MAKRAGWFRRQGVGLSGAGLAVLPAACGGATAESLAHSGTDEGLTLAVANGAVAGLFVEQRGRDGGPRFSCIFLFCWVRARYRGGKPAIAGWLPAGDLAVVLPLP